MCRLLKNALSRMEAKIGADAYIVAWYLGRCMGEVLAQQLKVSTQDSIKSSLERLSSIKFFKFTVNKKEDEVIVKASKVKSCMEEALAKGIIEGYLSTIIGSKVVAKKVRKKTKTCSVFILIYSK
ncbi:MAG: hypothetical protein DRJ52_07330 [Thermoprotei archaeon]|nr:MAG: hypothetical protein DRJ52_07330 [Thermoprotei archaeon]RLF00864.1 MAG: hypothetical protein DRJ63_01180 [Thermoprotei archaeon]